MKKSFIFAILAMVMLVFTGCKEVKEEKYSNGEIRVQTEINSEGVKDGFHKEFSQKGILLLEEEYKNGKKDGKCRTYYEDGTLQKLEVFKDDKKNGDFIKYNKDGNILFATKYIDGKENGIRYEYNEKGVLTAEYTLKDGTLNGYFKDYNLRNGAWAEGIYGDDGSLLEKKTWRNNHLVYEFKKTDGKITINEYSDKTNKLIYEKVRMVDGGDEFTKKYTDDGILIQDENKKNGETTTKTYKKDPDTNKYYLYEISEYVGDGYVNRVFNPDGTVQNK